MSKKEAEEKAKEKADELEKQVEDAVKEVKAPEDVSEAEEASKDEPAEGNPPKEKGGEEAKDEEESGGATLGENEKGHAEESDKVPPAEEPPKEEIDWTPKTNLGKEVLAGKYKTLEDILKRGKLILEPEIVDVLVPDLKQEVVYIGGSPGKGGGIRRTATKMTARMHKSGRRFKLAALAIIGNENGIAGIGKATSKEHRTALEKATKNAKLNVIRVRRGCGSWECGCGGVHSVPYKVEGREGSVHVSILPAPKGVGIVASEEVRKILRLAGIKDAWVKTSGKTSTRANLVMAFFNALKNLNSGKGDL
jgi:small subunit ribosomal protein S5